MLKLLLTFIYITDVNSRCQSTTSGFNWSVDLKVISIRFLCPGLFSIAILSISIWLPDISDENLHKEGRIKRNEPWEVMFFGTPEENPASWRERCSATWWLSMLSIAAILIDTRVSQNERNGRVQRSIFSLSFRNERAPLVRDWLMRSSEHRDTFCAGWTGWIIVFCNVRGSA